MIEDAKARGIELVIPPKKNRKAQRFYDKALYRYRHLVENAFLHLKRWRGIPHDMPKTMPHLSPSSRFAVWLFSLISRDDTIYGIKCKS